MKIYGLIGHPLGHSFSQKYFRNKFEKEAILGYDYKLFDLPSIDTLSQVLHTEKDLLGLNVTIPYKEAVFPYLHEIDEHALKIGAVNVVKIVEGKLKGFNSDYVGFLSSLDGFLPVEQPMKALILGTGGASKAVAYALAQMNYPYRYVSRERKGNCLSYEDLHQDPELLNGHHLIINTTPLGTTPNTERCPDIPYHQLKETHFLYDLVYNPAITLFMKNGASKGSKVKNGHEMLVSQAEEAWRIWQNS